MTDNPTVKAAIQFCDAFTARDWDRAAAALNDDINFTVGGTSPLAGEYTSVADVIGLLQQMVELSGDTLCFSAGADSYDILTSDVHVAILVPFSAQRGDRSLDYSYQIWQFHAGPAIGGYGGIYAADQQAFDAFWS